MSTAERLLSIDGVTGGYGDADILRDLHLHIDAGEIVVVVGPNGAGKSTAMKAVFGLVKIRDGRVLLDGDDITRLKTERIVRRGVAYVPQVQNVFPSLSVAENLEMGAFLRDGDFSASMERVYELFPVLKERRRVAAGVLSGGQRQMVAMGRALMLDPKLLLLDEPTAGLSPKFMDQIFAIVHDINRLGVGILMVEQNARQALAMAGRGYVLVTGHTRFEDTGPALLANREVAEMFLGG